MPKRRYQRREPTHEWSHIRPLLKDAAQIRYELIRPVILWGVNVKERAAETGVPRSSIYYQANLLFGRRPSAQTIKLTLANGPKPSRTARRFPPWPEIADPRDRRLAVIKLHVEGWTPTSIAGYLGTSRQTVSATLKRWIEEQFAGLPDKSSRPHQPATKTTLRAMQEVKKLQINPELGEYRVSAALEQLGIKLSPRTCGRILALNRARIVSRCQGAAGIPRKSCLSKQSIVITIGS
jgi:transposase